MACFLCDEMGALLSTPNTQGPDGQAQAQWRPEGHQHTKSRVLRKISEEHGAREMANEEDARGRLLAFAFAIGFSCLDLAFLCSAVSKRHLCMR